MILLVGSTIFMLVGRPAGSRFGGWLVGAASVGLCLMLCRAFLGERWWLQDRPEHWVGLTVVGRMACAGLSAHIAFVTA